jgi:hypothetical protein
LDLFLLRDKALSSSSASPVSPNDDFAHDLLVEDNEDDVLLTKRAIKAAGVKNSVHLVQDGQISLRRWKRDEIWLMENVQIPQQYC